MPDLPLLLSARQAAELVGVNESTWNRWVAVGRVPSWVLHPVTDAGSKRRRYSRAQVEQWAAGNSGAQTEEDPTFSRARALLGQEVTVTLDHENGTVATGTLIAISDSGEFVVCDEEGFAHFCWPMLEIQPAGE